MTTPRDLIKDTLIIGGVQDPVEDVDADAISVLFSALNRMISAWSNDERLIFADTQISHVLSAGTGIYTIGSGATIDTTRPMKIKDAFIRGSDNIDNSLEIIDEYKYNAIADKTILDPHPSKLYYKTGFPTGTIKLHGVPSQAYTLFLDVTIPLSGFTSLSQTIELPPGYEEAIVYNLWKRRAASYTKPLTPEQNQIAEDGLDMIRQANRSNDLFEMALDTPFDEGGYFDGDSRTMR